MVVDRAMPLEHLNLKLLKSLHVLLIEQNVSRAAKRLGVSQSALSSQLKRLRGAFGDELLVPSRFGMVPTPRGTALAASLSRVLGDIAGLVTESEAFRQDSSDRHFRIAMTEYCQHVASGHLIAAAHAAAPHVRLSVVTALNQKVYGDLQGGDVDLLIGGTTVLSDPLRSIPLWTDSLMFAQRKGHPRGRAPVTLDELALTECVSNEFFTDDHRTQIDEALMPLQIRRPIMINVSSYRSMIETIKRTDLVAAVPLLVGKDHADELDLFELPVKLEPFTAYAAWHERHQHDAAHRWLRNLARTVCDAEIRAP